MQAECYVRLNQPEKARPFLRTDSVPVPVLLEPRKQ